MSALSTKALFLDLNAVEKLMDWHRQACLRPQLIKNTIVRSFRTFTSTKQCLLVYNIWVKGIPSQLVLIFRFLSQRVYGYELRLYVLYACGNIDRSLPVRRERQITRVLLFFRYRADSAGAKKTNMLLLVVHNFCFNLIQLHVILFSMLISFSI